MARQYRTRDGDTLDWIVWRVYGRQDGRIVERVLADNRHLADQGPILPAGLVISLPEISSPAATESVRLWG